MELAEHAAGVSREDQLVIAVADDRGQRQAHQGAEGLAYMLGIAFVVGLDQLGVALGGQAAVFQLALKGAQPGDDGEGA